MRRRLPRFLFEYVDGGSYDEVTLRGNSPDLHGVALWQRVLRDVSHIDLGIELFGQRQAQVAAEKRRCFLLPFHGIGLFVARGFEAATRPFWFQSYRMRDRAVVTDCLAEACARGSSGLVFTVDMPIPGSRYRDYRSGLAGTPGSRGPARRMGQALLRLSWAMDVGLRGGPHSLGKVALLLGRKHLPADGSGGNIWTHMPRRISML